jgi:hypothetical protein
MDQSTILTILAELRAEGFLDQAKDAQGQLVFREGKPVWRLTEKGLAEARSNQREVENN